MEYHGEDVDGRDSAFCSSLYSWPTLSFHDLVSPLLIGQSAPFSKRPPPKTSSRKMTPGTDLLRMKNGTMTLTLMIWSRSWPWQWPCRLGCGIHVVLTYTTEHQCMHFIAVSLQYVCRVSVWNSSLLQSLCVLCNKYMLKHRINEWCYRPRFWTR